MHTLRARHGLIRSRHAHRSPVAGLAAALLLSLLGALPALAHAELVSSDPADRARLATPPTTITLTFSQALDPAKSSFKLLGPDGATIGTGTATADAVMTLGGLSLGSGTYEVKWTSASADDGDIARGELSFTVAAAASAAASAEATELTTGSPAAPASTDVLLPLVAALVVVVAGGAFVLRRSRGA